MGLFDFVGEITGTNAAASSAIGAQRDAANQSNATQKEIYNQQREDNAPYRQAGLQALTGMQDPSFNEKFSADKFQQDPGYQFQMDEGMKALQRSAAAKGGLMSGGTLKELTGYSQGVANQSYGQAYDRFTNEQNNRFGRLGTIAGMGQGAQSQQNQAAQNYGNNVSQTQMGLGNASAAAHIGAANANSQMIGQAGGTAAMIFSDERLKTDVTELTAEDRAELKSTLKAFRFHYLNQEHGAGEQIGIMAQDLEKSKIGRTLVTETADGFKQINLTKILGLFLADMAGN